MGGVCSDPALTHNERILLNGQNFGTGHLTSYMHSTGAIPAGVVSTTKTVTTTTPVVQTAVTSSGFNTGIGSYGVDNYGIPAVIGTGAALGGAVVGGSLIDKRLSEDRMGMSNAVPIVVDEPYTDNFIGTNLPDQRLDYIEHKEIIRDIPVSESVVTPPVVTTSSYVAPIAAVVGTAGAIGAATYGTTTTTTTSVVQQPATVSYTNTYVQPPTNSFVGQQGYDPNLVPSRIDIYGNRMWRETPSAINVPTSVINSAAGLKNAPAVGLPSTIGLDIYGNARRPLPTIIGAGPGIAYSGIGVQPVVQTATTYH